MSGIRGTARAADGCELAVTRFAAQGPVRGTLVIAGAMGVRQDFYAPFASFLAENGIRVLTFDWRGMGHSRPESLRGFETDVSTWAEQDLDGMLREAKAAAPNAPLLYLGHSLGGQVLGLAPSGADVKAAITVTAGSGYYKLNDRIPVQVRVLWFLAIPLLTPLFGYFPGKALRVVGDLPRGVAYQWRRWCLHPEYLLAEGPHYREALLRVKAPILGYSFDDDPLIPRPAIDHLHSFYAAARVERRHVAPAELGVKAIGHFGFFSEKRRDTLWRPALDWLVANAA